MRSSIPIVVGVAALSLLAACGRGGGGAPRVERIGERELTQRQFERFVVRYAGMPPQEIDPQARERLYEEFLAEVLFARAAERTGIEPSEEEVRRELERFGGAASGPEWERDARQAVLARAYEERVLVPRVRVGEEEVRRALGATASPSRSYAVFRQIRVESKERAAEAYRRVARRREPFDAVAREISTAPDRGALQQRPFDNLPGPVAAVLRKLPEGGISRPVAYDGAFYLFELEARNHDPDPDRSAERRRVRERIRSEKLARLRREELRRLAALEGVRMPGAPAEEQR